MSVNYDLQITTGGYIMATLEDIIVKVSGAIGLHPGYTYQRTEITGNVIHIYYTDENASDIRAEPVPAIPFIVYAILAVISILGIAYISYQLFTVAPSSTTGMIAVATIGLLAIGYLLSQRR